MHCCLRRRYYCYHCRLAHLLTIGENLRAVHPTQQLHLEERSRAVASYNPLRVSVMTTTLMLLLFIIIISIPRVMTLAYRRDLFSKLSGYRALWIVIFETALSISRKSSGASSTETASMFYSMHSSLLVRGIGTIHGFWASSQASAI